MHSPHLGNAHADAAPRDAAQALLLRAIGAIIAHEVVPTVGTMLGFLGTELMIEGVQLPLPETLVYFLEIHCFTYVYINYRQLKCIKTTLLVFYRPNGREIKQKL